MLAKVILGLGCAVVAVAAAWASFSTLASLAEATEWPGGYWLLPTSIDALGAVACYVWLTKSFPADSRKFGQRTTLAAIAVSVAGNAVGHLVSSGALAASVVLIVLVGAVPPLSLAAVIHLIVQCTSSEPKVQVQDAAPVPAQQDRIVPGPAPKPKPSPKPKPKVEAKSGPAPVKSGPDSAPVVDDVELQRARHADRGYRAKNGGEPITRDALKTALKIGTGKATDLLAVLKTEREVA